MIRLLLLCFFFIINSAFCQDKYADSIKSIITADFAGIQIKDFKNLIPFKTEEGTGYVHAKTKKIMLKPSYYELDFAKPNLKGNYNNVIYFEINSQTKDIKVDYQNWQLFGSQYRDEAAISKAYAKGFYAAGNKIYNYSNIYSYCPALFKYKNEYFAIAEINKQYAVINSDGDALKNLQFDYSSLKMIRLENDVIWFKYKTTAGEEGFINMDGEKKLVNEIISNSRTQTNGSFNYIDTEHSIDINYYGYGVESNDEFSGVIDFTTMSWLIKPQKNLKIEAVNYTAETTVSDKFTIEDRKKLKFYFLVNDEKNNTSYYIDESLKKYLPKS
jgi:hypothetical protein